MRLIKRYRNYHFYDTVDKTYLTLSEMAYAYVDHTNIKVIVYDTKKDITEVTLSKIERIRDGIKNDDIYSKG
jgi:polyhydroxyalkanoate synthesis regulator protein